MASKIPVGRTIVRGYRFAFGNIINNLGVIWIPFILMSCCSYFLMRPHMTQFTSSDPQVIRQALPSVLLYTLVVFFLTCCQMAALTKEALGLRVGRSFLQFPFGAAAWRLIASYLLCFLEMIVILIATLIFMTIIDILLGSIGSALSGDMSKPMIRVMTGVSTFAVFCTFVYIAVRLSFLLAPVCVAEKRIALIRSWELTRGNFWRVFAVLLSVIVPLLIFQLVYLYVVYGNDLIPPIGRHMSQEAIAQFHQHQKQLILSASRRMQSYWYLTYPLGLLFAVVTYGLSAGLSAFAYEEIASSDLGDSRGWFGQWVSRSLGPRATTTN